MLCIYVRESLFVTVWLVAWWYAHNLADKQQQKPPSERCGKRCDEKRRRAGSTAGPRDGRPVRRSSVRRVFGNARDRKRVDRRDVNYYYYHCVSTIRTYLMAWKRKKKMQIKNRWSLYSTLLVYCHNNICTTARRRTRKPCRSDNARERTVFRAFVRRAVTVLVVGRNDTVPRSQNARVLRIAYAICLIRFVVVTVERRDENENFAPTTHACENYGAIKRKNKPRLSTPHRRGV